jgi:hypothetical protein
MEGIKKPGLGPGFVGLIFCQLDKTEVSQKLPFGAFYPNESR